MDESTQQKQLLRARGICVVIPTYNNAGTIVQVVKSTLACCDDVIVVNDGSTDATTSLLQGLEGITLVHYAANRGKGYALRKGFCKAREMGFAYAITLDADGQHYPEHIGQRLRQCLLQLLVLGADRASFGRHADRLPPLSRQETLWAVTPHLAL